MTAKRQRGSSVTRVTLKSGEVRWRFRLDIEPGPDGRRRQRTLSYRTEKEAVSAQARARGEVETGEYVERTGDTVADAIDAYLGVKALAWRPSTLAQNTSALKPLRDRLGSIKIQRLRDVDVSKALAAMLASGGRAGEGRSLRTVHIARQQLVAALERAVLNKLARVNVAANVELPSFTYKKFSTWSAEQLRAFLETVDDSPLIGVWALSARGLRRGEALAVRWSDVDWKARTVRVHRARVIAGGKVIEGPLKTAGTPERFVPMDAPLERALRLTRERTGIASGNVVSIKAVGDRHIAVDALGEPLHPGWYAREFRRIVKEAGLPEIRVHDLRHTAATLMVRSGQSPADIADILGHSVEVLLSTYTHPDGAEKRVVMDAYAGMISTR